MPTLITPIQYSTGRPSQRNQARQIKGIQTGKEKLFLFADDMTLHKENFKESIRKTIGINQ